MKRLHSSTVLLLTLILVLGTSLAIRQRREGRLRAALALYKQRAGGALNLALASNPTLDWPAGTPLRHVIQRVSDSAPGRGSFPKGLPVVVDPDGLREAGRTLDSPVGVPPTDAATGKPLPLGRQLESVLAPMGLAAVVKDGAIVITARGQAQESSDSASEEREP